MASNKPLVMDYYAVLGVSSTASQQEIKQNWHRQARLWHPDTNPHADTAERALMHARFCDLGVAYKVLSNPTTRKEYDAIVEALVALKDAKSRQEQQPHSELVYNYAILNSRIDANDFQGARPARNAGIIEEHVSNFALSYVDSEGQHHAQKALMGGLSLISILRECTHLQTCTFSIDEDDTITSGYTFISTKLLEKKLRWSCSDHVWTSIHTKRYQSTPSVPLSKLKDQTVPPSIIKSLTLREIVEGDLRAGGALSETLPGYNERAAQIAMARSVADALEAGSDHLVVEAATGTGKSLAYLLPIIRSGKVAIVSTANKALQEQLFYKDIPFIQDHIQPFEAALLKGMGNYLCLDRLSEEHSFQQLVHNPAYEAMTELIGEYERWDGDLDLLEHSLPASMRAAVAADSEQCAWRACPHFHDCYVRRVRDRARDAQVIVVNHTLLLLDAVMNNSLLPERDLIVIDEAHHLEEEATRAFTVTVTPGRVQSLLSQRRLREHADLDTQQEAAAANANAWDATERVLPATPWPARQPLRAPIQEGLHLATAIADLASSLQRNRPLNMEDKEEQLYEKLIKRTGNLAKDLKVAFSVEKPEEIVYYVERLNAKGRARAPQQLLAVSATPLSVAEELHKLLFSKVGTVCTSATLAVGGSFQYFRARVGLSEARDQVLPLTFDYRANALLYVPRMRHEPAFGNANGPYLDEMAQQMRDLVEASGGRAFLLFSSQRALEGVLERIGEPLRRQGFTVLVQGQEMGRVELLRQFREQPAAILFGLKSFWEGVDVAGEALSLVVIDKLPFDPPDDPVHEARVSRMKAQGENWFGGYVLPQATLRLKQGIGRLLRTPDDRGVMAILDSRLHTKSYGRQVLAALPPARRTIRIEDVRAFFDAG